MEPIYFPGQLFNDGYDLFKVYSVTLFENAGGDIRELIVAKHENEDIFSAYVYSWDYGIFELYDEFEDAQIAFTETRDWLESGNFTRVNA
jgi:hypothetical protein